MASDQNRKWLPILLIAAGLAAWGVLLALGAYLAPVGAAAGHDRRKLWVVAATTGGFLLAWGLTLAVRTLDRRRPNMRADVTQGTTEGDSRAG